MPRSKGKRLRFALGVLLLSPVLAQAQQVVIDGGPFSSTRPPTTPGPPPTTPGPPPTTPGPPPTTPGLAPQPQIAQPLPSNPWGVPITNNGVVVSPGVITNSPVVVVPGAPFFLFPTEIQALPPAAPRAPPPVACFNCTQTE